MACRGARFSGLRRPPEEAARPRAEAYSGFHSVVYEWLVVSGARAQYKGTGTINGAGNYGFLLTAIDGQINGGGGTDKFRVKIWDKNNGDTTGTSSQICAEVPAPLTLRSARAATPPPGPPAPPPRTARPAPPTARMQPCRTCAIVPM